MSTPLFNVVVSGIQKGVNSAKVKARFSQMFRLETAQVERVFNATPILLRRNIPEDFAISLVKRLSAIGVSAQKVTAESAPPISKTVVSKAIYFVDHGEISNDASSMHQPVDFFYGTDERRIPFIFTGSGFTYCKLWLVNVLVCVLSAGIFYPWAKARSLSYLYQHTYFDGKIFQCTENSKRIYFLHSLMLVFLIALVLSFLYSFMYFLIGVFVFISLFPYYHHKCNQLHYGQFLFCGFNVQPNASLREIYVAMLGWPILALLTFGVLAPRAAYHINYSQLHKKYIGSCEFRFTARLDKYWTLLLPLFIAELLVFACVYWRLAISVHASVMIIIGATLLVFIHWRVTLEKLRWNNLNSALGYFVCSWSFVSYSKLVLQNTLLCVLTFGLYWPWAKMNTVKYKANHLAFFSNQGFGKWRKRIKEVDANSVATR